MFTGIVEELGTVTAVEPRAAGVNLTIRSPLVLGDAAVGNSIAVNGACLTAVAFDNGEWRADVSPETLQRTNLGDLQAGSRVNLERPLAANGRLNGHFVLGHVDGTGEVSSLAALGGGNWWLRVRVLPELSRYVVVKGSVAVDGISLTVAELDNDLLGFTVIPHTYQHTTLQFRQAGTRVNIEVDILAKHLEKLMIAQSLA